MTAFRVNYVGRQFDYLVVTRQWHSRRGGRERLFVHCKCSCGRELELMAQQLLENRKHPRSCGCALDRAKHGHARDGARSPEHTSWTRMRHRCLNPHYSQYGDYGGRGIRVCERWANFENFLADMGPRPPGATLERIDNNGNYEPGNCRWATRAEQMRNTRRNVRVTAFGRTQVLRDWATEFGINSKTLSYRLRVAKMRPEEALTRPIDTRCGGRRALQEGQGA